MQSASLKCLVLVGLFAPIAGCYSYGYQSPYGPGPYGQPYQPMYPGNPGYTVPPGTPYVPGGTTPGLGGPTPLPITPPNGSTPPSTYDSNGGGIKFDDAPPFNPNPGGTPGATPAAPGNPGENRGTVPDPADDLNTGPAATRPQLSPTSGQDMESPFEQESNNSGDPEPPARVGSEPDLFEPPDRVQSLNDGSTDAFRRVSFEVSTAESPNPYGRDRKHANPEWLRGVVSFDSQARTWEIIYSATPDSRDPNGGSLTLANHPDLARVRSGDVVLVEGAIDGSHPDQRGKPMYAIDKVTPLTAR